LPAASVTRLSALAWVPWDRVDNKVLPEEAALRKFTPSGMFTQTGKGKAGADGLRAVAADFGIGRDAGQVVGDGCGSAVAVGRGRLATAGVLNRDVSGPTSRKAATAPMTIRGIRRRADLICLERSRERQSYASGLRFGRPARRGYWAGVGSTLSTMRT